MANLKVFLFVPVLVFCAHISSLHAELSSTNHHLNDAHLKRRRGMRQSYRVILSIILLVVFSKLLCSPVFADTVYVDESASGDNNGTSWANAYTDLQSALEFVDVNESWEDEIRVAEGVYKPTWQWDDSCDDCVSFRMRRYVPIKGGYPSGGGHRDWQVHTTILSGDIGVEGDDTDNVRYLIYNVNSDNTAVLDGFTLTGAKPTSTASGPQPSLIRNVSSSPIIRNCTFQSEDSYIISNSTSSPVITNCFFYDNSSYVIDNGASSPHISNCLFNGNQDYAVFNDSNSSPEIVDSTFSGNTGGVVRYGNSIISNCLFLNNSKSSRGGVIEGRGTIVQSVFSGNSAPEGGAIYFTFYRKGQPPPSVSNSVFVRNSADLGSAIYIEDTPAEIVNNIIRNPSGSQLHVSGAAAPLIAYNNIYGGYPGPGNIDADPLFVNTLSGDYHLRPGSPCIDAGSNLSLIIDRDSDNEDRLMDGDGDGLIFMDMGIDEVTGVSGYIRPSEVWVDDDWEGALLGDTVSGHVFGHDAFDAIQLGINSVEIPGTVHVAGGSYHTAINLRSGVYLAGENPETVNLDGQDLNGPLVIASGVDSTAILEGITIQNSFGEAMTIEEADPTINRCRFLNNNSAEEGNDICWLVDSSPVFANTVFHGNHKIPIRSFDSEPEIINCVFTNNSGGINSEGELKPRVSNSIFYGNVPIQFDSIREYAVFRFSNIEGGHPGTGNIDEDPGFVNITSLDFNPGPDSPSINSGDPRTDILLVGDIDFAGVPRVMDARIDMGVMEFQSATEEIFYVDGSVVDGGGSSWQSAFDTLNDAIDSAGEGDEIWVAAGTYKPDRCYFGCNESSPREKENSFHLVNGVTIYGGFSGNESDVSQRDPELNWTILSGDIGIAGDPSDNVKHVIYNNSTVPLDQTAILDGFHITGGYSPSSGGGGMRNTRSSPTVRNCVFRENHARDGGAISNGLSSPVIENCRFEENVAFELGGAISNDRSSPSILKSSFLQNSVRYDSPFTVIPRGGAIANRQESSPLIANTFFSGNQVLDSEGEKTGYGGAISTYDNSNVTIANSSFSGNLSTEGSGLASIKDDSSLPSTITITNSILWDEENEIFNEEDHSSIDIRYSAVRGGFGAIEDNNIFSNPRFVDVEQGDLHLQESSPCINAGNNGDVPIDITTDIDGENRVQLSQVDVGADETPYASSVHHVWVDDDYTFDGTNDGHSWGVNAFTTIQEGIDASSSYVYVAPGIYTENIELKSWMKLQGSGPEVTVIDGGGIGSVVKIIDLVGEISISGFTIRNGSSTFGGGLYSENTVYEVANCYFVDNQAEWSGGGLHSKDSTAKIINCLFKENHATVNSVSSGNGGGLSSSSGELLVINSIFTGNNSVNSGGGLYIGSRNQTAIINCTLAGNQASSGNGIAFHVGGGTAGDTEISNSILWNGGDEIESDFVGFTVRNSLLSDGYILGDLVDVMQGAEPRFISPETGDFHVDKYSPCVGRGSNNFVPMDVTTDFDGNQRIQELTVDIGAYETTGVRIVDVWVDDDYLAGGYNDGHLWGVTAFSTITDATEAALAENVRVLPGTYQETVTLKNDISIIGSGPDLTYIDGKGENRGVVASQVDMSARLEGFTIQNGEYAQGGGMSILHGSPTIVNCRFMNNHSDSEGGGIYMGINCAPRIINCRFEGNVSEGNGGAVYCNKSSHPDIYNSVFYNNSAGPSQYGGGIYVDENAIPVIAGSTFHDNRGLFGGALYVASASPAVTNTIFWGNHPDEIYVRGTTSAPYVSYCNIEGGYNGSLPGENIINEDPRFAEPSEGDLHLMTGSPCIDVGSNVVPLIYAEDIDGDERIIDGDRNGNAVVDIGADEHVPQLYVNADWAGCQNGNPIGDLVCGVDAFGTISVAVSVAGSPTIIYVSAGIYAEDSLIMKDGVQLIGENPVTTIIRQSSQSGGTIFYCDDLGSDTVIKGFTIREGGAGNMSFPYGAVEINNSTLVFNDCIFEENSPIAVFNDGGSPRFVDCIFRDNQIGMYNKNNANSVLERCLFETNGLHGMYNQSSSPQLSFCDFINNNTIQSVTRGGAMYNEESNPRITDSHFIDNVLDSDDGDLVWGSGGALYNWYSSPEILRCEFIGNRAVSGGAIANLASSPVIADCLFRNNSNKNSTDSHGGAIYNNGVSAPPISNSMFIGNSSYYGGAIYYALSYAEEPTATIVNSIFLNNSSFHNGGAINSIFVGMKLHVSNSVFYGNTADSDGDGLGVGGAFYNDRADVSVVNSILWGNNGGEVENLFDHIPILVQYSDIQGGYGVPADQNIDDDPLFVNASEEDFSLQPGSPCINKGTSVSADIILPELDIEGTSRPQGSEYDMGAYELVYLSGDLNMDGQIDLLDTVIALRILVNLDPGTQVSLLADLNGDGRICIEEAINALREAQVSGE